MLPSRGNCHAVFLLIRAAHLKRPTSLDAWIAGARQLSTFMAAALDLESMANALIRAGLAKIEDRISIEKVLDRLWAEANRSTLLEIARILFQAHPPRWLESVVGEATAAIEYIPTDDFLALEWLGPDLEPLVTETGRRVTHAKDADLRKRLGDAGERVVLAAKALEGASVTHVASISDFYGYDIEAFFNGKTQRIEVKAAVPRTADNFIISRNEYNKSVAYGDEWCLIQIVFATTIFLKNEITCSDILAARTLSARSLQKLANLDTPSFMWLDAAKISPPTIAWTNYTLPFTSNMTFDVGFKALDE
ncbi:TPA: DUF3883 domain-containing protein [Burkholderia cenocepacia]|nr:DUF3883 domain-containing protein [Burkholderia cenocepacia]HDR9814943.1 DUF3883 domain-containing protein [Burkholderia cenocepacia]HDR9817244.1 DUF3883 domain-containing protein [Burkholderia cenocepacia]HDR9832353.1 DUF3883 domain-containing protein [Burkholderia cenocepacia]